jgi:tripartite-type tricarboxylate transporter receptor subunit TctC
MLRVLQHLACALSACCAVQAHAQGGAASYPSKPIRMIVPLAAGGPSDTIARIVAAKMTEAIGQNVIVENRPGASGIIGTEVTVRSPADGYTIELVSNTISVNPAVFRKLPYEFDKDLAAVSLLAATPYVLTVHPSLPVKSVKELIALARARPGQLNHASGGVGTGPHLAMEWFGQLTGIKFEQIVYKGGGPALIDFIAGQTQLYMANMVTMMPHVRSGKARALAISKRERSPAAPELPTLHELGLKDFDEGGQHGIVAPIGVPKEILSKLHGAIVSAMRNPDVGQRLAAEGSVAVASTPEEYRALILRETAKWKKVAQAAGIQPQ